MFYSVQLLAKKGPLGTIWIAGHLDKRLKRNQIYETNIATSVDSIINPEAPLALRLSGQLLLGVVRIYSRKITYLYSDCNDALVKIKQAFKAADVDLPNDGNIAPMHAITLPDNFDTLDFGINAPNFLEINNEDAGIGVTYGRRSSFVLADDLNDFFGSQRSIDEEQFEVAGEELHRHFSGGLTPERLRAAPAGEHNQLQPLDELFDNNDRFSTGAPPEDELLAPPMDDLMLGMEGTTPLAPPSEPLAGPSPSRSQGLPALSDMGNISLPGSSLRGTPADAQEDAAAETHQQPQQSAGRSGRPPRPTRQALKITKKLRPAKQDVTSGNKPLTELPKAEIMSLLRDASSLIKVRNNASSHSQRVPDAFHVARHSELAQESMLHWPAVPTTMAPQLFSLYTNAMSTKQERAAAQQAQVTAVGQAGQTVSRTDAIEEATAAVAEADELAAAQAAEPATALEMMPATEIAEPPAGPMDVDMAGPDPMFDQHDFAAGQDATMMDGQDGLSTGGGPADDGGLGGSMATPPLTDGQPMLPDTAQASELQSVGSEGHAKDSFTNRTKMVLNHLQTNFSGAKSGSVAKKRRLSSGSPLNMGPQVSMNALVEGKGRRDASRWFFEMLVLKTRNYVNLSQEEPYADISISATSKLLTMS